MAQLADRTASMRLAEMAGRQSSSNTGKLSARPAGKPGDFFIVMEHPDTLTSVNNLAALFYSQGDYAQAEILVRRAIEAQERVLGIEHPETLRSFNNLAKLFRSQGDYAQAEPLCRRALDGCTKTLGPDHPLTKTVRDNLAALRTQGET